MSTLPIGETAGAVAALCWSVSSILIARLGGTRSTSAGALNLAKSTLPCVVLGGLAIALHGAAIPAGAERNAVVWLVVSGVVGIAIGDTFFFAALAEVGAARAILLLSTAPIFVLAIEIVQGGTLPPSRDLLGVALSLGGVVIVMLRRPELLGARPRHSLRGLVFGGLSGLCQAVGSLMSRHGTRGALDPLSASWMRLLAAVLALGLLAIVTGKLARWTGELRVPGTMPRIATATMIGTVCGLWLAQIALAKSSSGGVAATLLATSPVFAIPLAHVTKTERATPLAVVGVLVAFCGIAVLTLGH